ncbi:MAG: DivIVA domain-containing protein [Actinobacteria bacterium]|nr:DivIVA domain-containing protein [Actinomycetota bacterium]MDQ3162958.1 DivIVA domain-containing protein [Actinomycetota bacterium]
MALTPVEIRHLKPSRGFLGYRRNGVDRLLTEIADSFADVWRERADLADKVEALETDIDRHKELEALLRTTLVSAERAAHEMKDQARREADNIIAESHAEARAISRRAAAERERLDGELRRIRALLNSALATVDEATTDRRESVGESTGELRRLIS